MAKTILVVDDEERLVSVVKAYLSNAGYRVVTANNGRQALFVARHEKPDLIVLDVMMPEMDGHEFLRHYQQEADTPIIMLTAKVEEDDVVIGLELGADDYLTKPFSPRELMARVRAVLRRVEKEGERTAVLRIGHIYLDPDSFTVKVKDEPIRLTRSEFDLLMILMRSPGRVFSRLDLLDSLETVDLDSNERTIDVHIKNIRAKIEENPRKPHYIDTVYGVGYRFAKE